MQDAAPYVGPRRDGNKHLTAVALNPDGEPRYSMRHFGPRHRIPRLTTSQGPHRRPDALGQDTPASLMRAGSTVEANRGPGVGRSTRRYEAAPSRGRARASLAHRRPSRRSASGHTNTSVGTRAFCGADFRVAEWTSCSSAPPTSTDCSIRDGDSHLARPRLAAPLGQTRSRRARPSGPPESCQSPRDVMCWLA
jgi:hypothetical protein